MGCKPYNLLRRKKHKRVIEIQGKTQNIDTFHVNKEIKIFSMHCILKTSSEDQMQLSCDGEKKIHREENFKYQLRNVCGVAIKNLLCIQDEKRIHIYMLMIELISGAKDSVNG